MYVNFIIPNEYSYSSSRLAYLLCSLVGVNVDFEEKKASSPCNFYILEQYE